MSITELTQWPRDRLTWLTSRLMSKSKVSTNTTSSVKDKSQELMKGAQGTRTSHGYSTLTNYQTGLCQAPPTPLAVTGARPLALFSPCAVAPLLGRAQKTGTNMAANGEETREEQLCPSDGRNVQHNKHQE